MIGIAEPKRRGCDGVADRDLFFFSFGILMLSMFLGMLLMFLGALPLPMATAHMLAHDKLGAAFRVREWWEAAARNWLGYGISLVHRGRTAMVLIPAITMPYYSLSSVVSSPFVAPPIGFYPLVVSAATFVNIPGKASCCWEP